MKLRLRGLYPAALAWPRAPRLALLFAAAATIAVASSLDGSAESSLPGLRSYLLNWGHQLLYGALAIGIALAAGRRLPAPPAGVAAILAAVVAAGVLDELHQSGVPHRDSSVWDLVSDGLGASFALLFAGWTARRDRPVLELGPVLFCAGLSAAWNCVPAYAPNLPLTALLP